MRVPAQLRSRICSEPGEGSVLCSQAPARSPRWRQAAQACQPRCRGLSSAARSGGAPRVGQARARLGQHLLLVLVHVDRVGPRGLGLRVGVDLAGPQPPRVVRRVIRVVLGGRRVPARLAAHGSGPHSAGGARPQSWCSGSCSASSGAADTSRVLGTRRAPSRLQPLGCPPDRWRLSPQRNAAALRCAPSGSTLSVSIILGGRWLNTSAASLARHTQWERTAGHTAQAGTARRAGRCRPRAGAGAGRGCAGAHSSFS